MSDFELVHLSFQEVEASPGFAGWLAEQRLSVVLTNGNTLVLIGTGDDGTLSIVERQFGPCTSLLSSGPDTVYLSTRYQVWRLENALPPGEVTADGHDQLLLPQTAWTTGYVMVHGLGMDDSGAIVFVNRRFSCLSKLSERLNFDVVWVPPFVSELAPEDRCYLSGMAMEDGQPAYVTCGSRSDTAEGWRECRRDGGIVMSVPSGEVVGAGLSMPHSPVLLDGRLWLTCAGRGELGFVDVTDGRFEAVAQVPGFARGLCFHDHFALVAASRPRRGESFRGLPLADRLPGGPGAQEGGPKCGLFVVDLLTGRSDHWLVLDGGPPEIHDLAILPGVRSPTAIEFLGDEVQEWVTIPREDPREDPRAG